MPFLVDFRLRWQYKGVSGGQALFHRWMTGFRDMVGDYRPAFQLIAEDILEPVVRDIFKQESAEITWQVLTANTIRQRGSAHPILHRSGMLEESFQKGQPAHHEDITPKKLTWGSDVPYALFHQTGTGKGFGKDRVATGPDTGRGMPRRKELFLSERMKQQIGNVMIGRMGQVARMVGFGVTGERGLDPLTARMIGQKILGGQE
jgi:phage gpG-like protein